MKVEDSGLLNEAVAGWLELSKPSDSLPDATPVARSLTEQVAAHFQAYQFHIYRYLCCNCDEVADAQELTQEAFVRLYFALEKGVVIANIHCWLFVVARNLLLDHLKATRRRARRVTQLAEQDWTRLQSSLADSRPTPEQLCIEEKRRTALRAELSMLSAREQDCFHLRMAGLRYREIAEVLGIGLRDATWAVERAVTRLRARLGDDACRS